MIQTVEAVIDSSGRVLLLEDVALPKGHRALVTVLDERADVGTFEPALLSEASLAEDSAQARGGRSLVTPSVGTVGLVRFPFSDLPDSKLRLLYCFEH